MQWLLGDEVEIRSASGVPKLGFLVRRLERPELSGGDWEIKVDGGPLVFRWLCEIKNRDAERRRVAEDAERMRQQSLEEHSQ